MGVPPPLNSQKLQYGLQRQHGQADLDCKSTYRSTIPAVIQDGRIWFQDKRWYAVTQPRPANKTCLVLIDKQLLIASTAGNGLPQTLRLAFKPFAFFCCRNPRVEVPGTFRKGESMAKSDRSSQIKGFTSTPTLEIIKRNLQLKHPPSGPSKASTLITRAKQRPQNKQLNTTVKTTSVRQSG